MKLHNDPVCTSACGAAHCSANVATCTHCNSVSHSHFNRVFENSSYDLTSWIMSFRTAVNVGLAYTGFLLRCGCRASDDPRSCRLAALCRASKHISFWCSVCFVWKLSCCGIVIIKTKFWLRVVRLCFCPRYTRAWCNVRARSHDKAPVHFSEKSSIFGSPFLLIHRRWLHYREELQHMHQRVGFYSRCSGHTCVH